MDTIDGLNFILDSNGIDVMIYKSAHKVHFVASEIKFATVDINEGVSLKAKQVLMVFFKNNTDVFEFAFDDYEEESKGISFYNGDARLYLNFRK